MKTKKILSLLLTIALLTGLFATPALAGQNSWQNNLPDLQLYLGILNAPSYKVLPATKTTLWAHFDRGQIVYGFPWDVTSSDQQWKTAPPDQYGDDWDTANALDYQQVASSDTDYQDWQNGLQFTGSHSGQEPRYVGYDANLIEVSNENFPIDSSGMTPPAQVQMISDPWNSVINDPNYPSKGSGWPDHALTAIDNYTWHEITGAITDCWENDYGTETGWTAADGFLFNPDFTGGINQTNIMQYFELLTLPEPGNAGEVRFWHNNPDGSGPYYKDIAIPWQVEPQYVANNLTPFSGTQPPSSTQTVNGQTAAVYNTNGSQYTYNGTVTFTLQPDISYTGVTGQLANLMNLTMLSQQGSYSAPIAVCVNTQDNFATINQKTQNVYPVPANENAGGPNEGITLGKYGAPGLVPDSYTVAFTWSIPQGFSGTSMPMGAGIDDGINDYNHQAQADIIPSDLGCYCDPYETDHSLNYTNTLIPGNGTTGNGTTVTSVPVVGATQPQLIVAPSSQAISVGASASYTDTYYPNGQAQGNGQDVTSSSAWTSSDNNIAAPASTPGVFNGVAAGTVTVTASYTPPGGSALTGTATLMVQAQQPPGGGNNPPNPPNNPINPQPGPSGNGALSFQAVSQAGTNIMGVYSGSAPRPAGTAKWGDTVTATLTVPEPTPPQGTITSWSVDSASLVYPQKASDYTYDDPAPPAGTKTISMAVSGPGATAAFCEDWAEDGADLYSIVQGEMIATTPEPYTITASYSGTMNYEYTITDSDGTTTTVNASAPFSGTVSGSLEVDGTGVTPAGE